MWVILPQFNVIFPPGDCSSHHRQSCKPTKVQREEMSQLSQGREEVVGKAGMVLLSSQPAWGPRWARWKHEWATDYCPNLAECLHQNNTNQISCFIRNPTFCGVMASLSTVTSGNLWEPKAFKTFGSHTRGWDFIMEKGIFSYKALKMPKPINTSAKSRTETSTACAHATVGVGGHLLHVLSRDRREGSAEDTVVRTDASWEDYLKSLAFGQHFC